MDDGQAMEYEFDDQAEQLQGKLATDKIEENTLKVNNEEDKDNIMQVDEEDNIGDNYDMNDQDEDEIQQTQQQIQNKNMK